MAMPDHHIPKGVSLETLQEILVGWREVGAEEEPRYTTEVEDVTSVTDPVGRQTRFLEEIGVLEPHRQKHRLTSAGDALTKALAEGDQTKAKEQLRELLEEWPLTDELIEVLDGHPMAEGDLKEKVAEFADQDLDANRVDTGIGTLIDLYDWADLLERDSDGRYRVPTHSGEESESVDTHPPKSLTAVAPESSQRLAEAKETAETAVEVAESAQDTAAGVTHNSDAEGGPDTSEATGAAKQIEQSIEEVTERKAAENAREVAKTTARETAAAVAEDTAEEVAENTAREIGEEVIEETADEVTAAANTAEEAAKTSTEIAETEQAVIKRTARNAAEEVAQEVAERTARETANRAAAEATQEVEAAAETATEAADTVTTVANELETATEAVVGDLTQEGTEQTESERSESGEPLADQSPEEALSEAIQGPGDVEDTAEEVTKELVDSGGEMEIRVGDDSGVEIAVGDGSGVQIGVEGEVDLENVDLPEGVQVDSIASEGEATASDDLETDGGVEMADIDEQPGVELTESEDMVRIDVEAGPGITISVGKESPEDAEGPHTEDTEEEHEGEPVEEPEADSEDGAATSGDIDSAGEPSGDAGETEQTTSEESDEEPESEGPDGGALSEIEPDTELVAALADTATEAKTAAEEAKEAAKEAQAAAEQAARDNSNSPPTSEPHALSLDLDIDPEDLEAIVKGIRKGVTTAGTPEE